MKNKKIIDELPGKTIYESNTIGEVCHYFTDTYYCPIEKSTLDIPGKGAFNHNISSFLFTKLNQLSIPTQFIRSLNMRETLMVEGSPLPFDIHVRCLSGKKMALDFGISEREVFTPPLIEYTPTNKAINYSLNEDFLMSLDWATQEELDEVKDLALYTTRVLQGVLISFDLNLVEISLSMSYSPNGSIVISGQLFPEFFCAFDLKNHEYLGLSRDQATLDSASFDLEGHKKIAQRLGLYTPSTFCPPTFSPTALHIV